MNNYESLNTPIICCPQCRAELTSTTSGLACPACGGKFPAVGRIVDLAKKKDFYYGEVGQEHMRDCLALMEEHGYAEGLLRFLNTCPDVRAAGLDWYVDGVCRIAFQPLLPNLKNLTALDIGAGWGAVTIPLANLCKHVTALDMTRERLRAIEYRCKEAALNNVTLIQGGDSRQLPFADGQFDVITLIGVLEYIGATADVSPTRAQARFLREVFRVLRPGGTVIIGIENRYALTLLRGAPENHLNVPWLSVLPRFLGKIWAKMHKVEFKIYTHGAAGYRRLLRRAGFTSPSFFIPGPDYREINRITPGSRLPWVETAGTKMPVPLRKGPILKRIARAVINTLGGVPWQLQDTFLITASKNGTYQPEVQNIVADIGTKSGALYHLQWVSTSRSGCSVASLRCSATSHRVITRLPLRRSAARLLRHGVLVQQHVRALLPAEGTGKRLVPDVKRATLDNGTIYYVEEALDGARPNPHERDSQWFDDVVEFASQLANCGRTREAAWQPSLFKSAIAGLAPKSPVIAEVVAPFLMRAHLALAKHRWPLCPAHGDYRVENILVDAKGALSGVIDFEFASLSSPMGMDIMQFLICTRLDRLGLEWDEFAFDRADLGNFLSPGEMRCVERFWEENRLVMNRDTWFALQTVCWVSGLKILESHYSRFTNRRIKSIVNGPAVLLEHLWPAGSSTSHFAKDWEKPFVQRGVEFIYAD